MANNLSKFPRRVSRVKGDQVAVKGVASVRIVNVDYEQVYEDFYEFNKAVTTTIIINKI